MKSAIKPPHAAAANLFIAMRVSRCPGRGPEGEEYGACVPPIRAARVPFDRARRFAVAVGAMAHRRTPRVLSPSAAARTPVKHRHGE